MYYSIKQIKKSLPQNKIADSSIWVNVWVRQASFPLTWFFINLGFTANSVSFLAIVVSLLASVCFAIPATGFMVTGVILINLWLVLDCVDGNMARCQGRKSVYGGFVDAMSGYYTLGFVYLALGIHVYFNGGIVIDSLNPWLLVAGAVTSISDILSRLIYSKFCRANQIEGQLVRQEEEGRLSKIRKRIGVELGISGLFMPLAILCAFFNAYDLMVAFYFLFNVVALGATTLVYYVKANRFDNGK
ncbi:MAG: CDP-alcohol phosphatidyltransferase family protein [Bacteroidales bacterium]|nr:CDP-alcohol phosphatidyltransferase family protein [Bacteroidales bacterium]